MKSYLIEYIENELKPIIEKETDKVLLKEEPQPKAVTAAVKRLKTAAPEVYEKLRDLHLAVDRIVDQKLKGRKRAAQIKVATKALEDVFSAARTKQIDLSDDIVKVARYRVKPIPKRGKASQIKNILNVEFDYSVAQSENFAPKSSGRKDAAARNAKKYLNDVHAQESRYEKIKKTGGKPARIDPPDKPAGFDDWYKKNSSNISNELKSSLEKRNAIDNTIGKTKDVRGPKGEPIKPDADTGKSPSKDRYKRTGRRGSVDRRLTLNTSKGKVKVRAKDAKLLKNAVHVELDDIAKEFRTTSQKVFNKASKGSKIAKAAAKKQIAKMMKTKLAKKLALIATGTAIGGPLGTAVGIVSTGMDIRDIALLAQYYVDEAVGGIATGGRSLPGRSQADIGDEIAKAEKNLKNLDPNDSWLPSMGPGSYESLKAHYEKQLADLKKERDLPQEIARKRSELFNQSNLAYAKDFDDKEAEKNAFSADNIDNIPLGPPGPGADPETTPDAALAGGGGITTRQPPLVPGTSSSPGPGGSGATPGKKKVKVRRTSGGRGISGGGNIARAGRITHKARFKTGMGIKDIQKKLKAYFPEQSITFGTLREQAELSANPYTEPDGKWGKETYNAVIAFQKDLKKLMVAGKLKVTLPSGKTANEYLVDGIFGPDTAAATKAAEEAGLLVPGLKLDTSSVGPTKPSATKGPTKPAVKGELNTDGKAAKKIFFDMANKALQKVPQGIERDMAVKAYADSLASSWTADQLNQIGKGLKEFDKAKAETQKILDAEAEKYRKKVAAAQAIKDKKDREERLAQQALAAEAARAGAMNFYHNNIAQGAQRLPEESKAYAYLEKLINEEINKLLG